MHGPVRGANLIQSVNTLPVPAYIGQQPRAYNPQDGLQIYLAAAAALLIGTAVPFSCIPLAKPHHRANQARQVEHEHKGLDCGLVKAKDADSAWMSF